jgi:hypothetical protein
VQLFDTETDVAEVIDVARLNPEIAATIGAYLQSARSEIPAWEPKWDSGRRGKK